jgi:hypothetical protein
MAIKEEEYIKVTYPDGRSFVTIDFDWTMMEDAEHELTDVGDKITVERIRLTEAGFDAIPEVGGLVAEQNALRQDHNSDKSIYVDSTNGV